MLEDAVGSNDGRTERTFEAGKTYDVSSRLGRDFINMGVAEQVDTKPADPRERETKPESPPETKPSSPDEQKSDDGEVEKEPTSDGSAWYQFRLPNGELITYEDDGEEKVVKVLGEDDAEEKRKEFQQALEADNANDDEAP